MGIMVMQYIMQKSEKTVVTMSTKSSQDFPLFLFTQGIPISADTLLSVFMMAEAPLFTKLMSGSRSFTRKMLSWKPKTTKVISV